MTKINLIHTELSFEVKETSRIKSSDVHISQKLKGVKDMTMLSCAKKVTIILSIEQTPFKHWKKNIRSINPQSFSTLLVTFYSKTKQNIKQKRKKKTKKL